MNIVPVCECPRCRMLGLHLMPRVRSYTDRKPGVKAHVEAVPLTVAWYDGRDGKPETLLRTTYETSIIETYVEQVVRQCFFCGHEWFEEWRRKNIG